MKLEKPKLITQYTLMLLTGLHKRPQKPSLKRPLIATPEYRAKLQL
jgi:hypothetical protein